MLYSYLTKFRATKFDSVYLFCTLNETRMTYRNAYRDLEAILDKTGVGKDGIDGFFHSLRRKFAKSYIRSVCTSVYGIAAESNPSA